MKKLFLVLLVTLVGCNYEWEISRRQTVFRPAPMFCYSIARQGQCFATAAECVEDERIHSDLLPSSCRAVYPTR